MIKLKKNSIAFDIKITKHKYLMYCANDYN